MIDLGVQTKPKPVLVEEDEPAEYLILGDFGCRSAQPIAVDLDNLDAVMAKLEVALGGVLFRDLEDFHPARLYLNFPLFRQFDETAQAAEPERKPPDPDIAELLRSSSLLEQIADGPSADPFENYIRELAGAYAAKPGVSDPRREAALAEHMRGLLHHPHFQSIEAAWRGVDFALRAVASEGGRFYIAQYPKAEAVRELNGATSLRGTRALALLDSRKWRAIIGLYSFTPKASDIEFLGRMALLASHVRAPFLAEGSVDMGEYWDELRTIPEAEYLGLAVPRFLLRLPYGAKSSPVDSFPFEEMPDGAPEHSRFLWGNPALACLALLESGAGALNLEGLPAHTYQDDGEWKMTPCAEVWMTEAQVLALIDLGLMPLVSFKDSDRVRLAGFHAINGEELPIA